MPLLFYNMLFSCFVSIKRQRFAYNTNINNIAISKTVSRRNNKIFIKKVSLYSIIRKKLHVRSDFGCTVNDKKSRFSN
jgi:hypothetical protein